MVTGESVNISYIWKWGGFCRKPAGLTRTASPQLSPLIRSGSMRLTRNVQRRRKARNTAWCEVSAARRRGLRAALLFPSDLCQAVPLAPWPLSIIPSPSSAARRDWSVVPSSAFLGGYLFWIHAVLYGAPPQISVADGSP
jgi:hypothetical protein